MPVKRLMLVATWLTAMSGFAQDVNHDGWTTYLVPIAYSSHQVVHGGYGSEWRMELWAHNGSTIDLRTLQLTGNCSPLCMEQPPLFPVGATKQVPSIDSNGGDGGAL